MRVKENGFYKIRFSFSSWNSISIFQALQNHSGQENHISERRVVAQPLLRARASQLRNGPVGCVSSFFLPTGVAFRLVCQVSSTLLVPQDVPFLVQGSVCKLLVRLFPFSLGTECPGRLDQCRAFQDGSCSST